MSAKRTRAEINRHNAKKSTGPKTVEGKAASSKNAFKHGLYSKSACIPGENPEDLDALREDLRAEHQPASLDRRNPGRRTRPPLLAHQPLPVSRNSHVGHAGPRQDGDWTPISTVSSG